MTISTQDSKVNYQGNGQTTVFQIPFPFLENNQIYVQKKDAQGNLINYTYATDYTVTGAGEENGGSVTLNVAPEQGSTISIYRNVPLTQEVDYRENEIFPAETHEEALDKLTMEVQQIQEQLDRSVKVDRFSDVDLDIFVNEIERVYESTDNIDIVANNINDVNTVSGNIANVNTAVTNMAAIQDAPNQAISAQNSATQASQYATSASDSAQAAQDVLNEVHSLLAIPIGTIFQSVYVDESLDIARQLNGQLISSTKFTGFRSWLNTVQTANPTLFTTETNWQAEKTNSKLGQCGKFVVDDTAGTIRLPCVVNAQGLVDLALIGGIKSESLPNISGTASWGANGVVDVKWGNQEPYSNATGALSLKNTGTNLGGVGSTGSDAVGATEIDFKASDSSSTYKDNAPVQQEAVQYPYYIQVATGVEETLPAIREYNINTPFFFGQSMYSDVAPDNASWLVSNGQYNARSVYPDYYDWLVEQRNAGIKGFKGNTGYAWRSQTADIRFWTAIRNPSVGCAVYGGVGIPFAGTVTAINPDGTLNFYEVSTGVAYENLVYTESENINNEGTAFANLKFANDYDFIINTADQTFRLPLKNGHEGIFADGVKGNGMGLGFDTGVTGYEHVGIRAGDSGTSPVFVNSTNAYGKNIGETAGTGIATGKVAGITTDPSKSGMVVDKTVPSGWNLYYYVGDTVQDASLINAGAVLGQLSDKISRTATSDKELVVGWVMPDYTAKIETQNTTYTAPTKGWFYVVAQGSELKVSINSVQLAHGTRSATSYNICYSLPYMVNTGDVIAVTGADVSRETPLIAFYPCKCVSV